jgi:tetrahydromethanopterin S-methyltransferase subunit E
MADGVNASIDDLVRRTAGGRQVALVPEMMKVTHSVLDKAFSGNRVPPEQASQVGENTDLSFEAMQS